MRVLTLKTRTPANIKFPGYLEYTIHFKYYFHRASGVYGENTRMKRELREHIYLYISEISIDMNRECARFARSINHDVIVYKTTVSKVTVQRLTSINVGEMPSLELS